MTIDDLLMGLLRANLAGGAAIVLVLAVRGVVARQFGAGAAYALWLLPPMAAAAYLAPARVIRLPAAAEVTPTTPEVIAQLPAIAPERLLDGPVGPGLPWIGLWLAGAAACAAVLVWRQARFDRALGRLTPEGEIFRAEASGVGPAVVGTLRPRIVVPADFEAQFTPAERDVVLAHERAHLRRGDPLVNAVVASVQCLCWFNPLVHWAAHALRLDQEFACDAAVLQACPEARRRYAEAMLKIQLAPLAAPLGCHWPAGSAGPLKRRIALLKALPDPRRRAAGAALVAALSLGGGLAAWAAQPPRIEVQDAPSPILAAQKGVLEEALMEAIDEGYPDSIRQVVAAGADVNHLELGEGTPLIAAARLGDVATARLLLARGAQVNKPAPGDGSPLIVAAAHGRLEMVALLIGAGADPNQFVRHDETPLINAARHGDLAVVRYLVEHGADPNLAVPSGNRRGEMRSPLSMAANPLVAQYLRSRGARR